MGKPPAYIFVVRHGNRLDAVDDQWHLSSPTPYDPPLTYGGWLQSRTLGARVASILREREAEDEAAAAKSDQDPKSKSRSRRNRKRRHKVIIHSSPFLRCIQTSIAISAGLATTPSPSASSTASPKLATQSSRIKAQSFSSSPSRTRPPIPISVSSTKSTAKIEKCILRIDPFLGEWLSPDYFDHITPPPSTSMMLGTAKAELLRPEDYDSYPHFNLRHAPPSYTPSNHLWRSPKLQSTPLPTHDESAEYALDSLSDLRDSLPSNGATDRKGHRVSFSEAVIDLGYTAPVPHFAVSTAQPIPQGYVAHARDACIDVDYQWDSTRDTLGWGDGGELPEEWAAMHQRFRKGLKRLVDWYSTADTPDEMATKTSTSPISPALAAQNNGVNGGAADGNEEAEVEMVVILVSHGAGCNALTGGITNQPVLADVPMSSLTIARRRPEFDNRTDIVDESALKSIDDAFGRGTLGVPDIYELKLFANTDHLITPTATRSPSYVAVDARPRSPLSGAYTGVLRDISFGSSYYGGESEQVHRSNSINNASLGSMRRGSHGPSLSLRSSPGNMSNGQDTVTSVSGADTRPRTNSGGLWAPRNSKTTEEEVVAPDQQPTTPDHGPEQELKTPADASPRITVQFADISNDEDVHEAMDQFDADGEKLPGLWAGAGNGGLWGAPRPPGEAERLRDIVTHKRRWTVSEH